MPENTPIDTRLSEDLAAYFAITTSTPLPAGVARMNAASLRPQRRSLRSLLVPGGALLTGAAVVAVGFALSHASTSSNLEAGSAARGGNAVPGVPYAMNRAPAGDRVDYPGVNTGLLESIGHTRLGRPDPAVRPAVSTERARAAATAVEGSNAGSAGPAVLALVEDLSRSTLHCLCWVVDVPVGGAAASDAGPRTALIYIDASSGRYTGAHSGDGIP